MVVNRDAALFGALNARKMSPREIAASFVVSPQFEKIVGLDHAFLVGPRGSGKTTILRMLLDETLSIWDHARADQIRAQVSYSAIFVPADRLWSSQVELREVELSPEQRRAMTALGVAAFGTQLLSGFVETLQYRLGHFNAKQGALHPAEMTSADEVSFVEDCSLAWQLRPRTKTLNGLAAALDQRFLGISELVERTRVEAASTAEMTALHVWDSAPMASIRLGIRSANRHTRQPNHRWALLLDEMELAPEEIHQTILSSVRGGERNLILKLSFSPFDHNVAGLFEGVGASAADNDFVPVYLWSGDRRSGRKFADTMFRQMLRERVGAADSSFRILGPSQIDSSGRNWQPKDFELGSRKMELLRSAEANDTTFATYLQKHAIDLEELGSLSYFQRSATLRKFFPLLVFRDALLRFGVDGVGRRSRKKVEEVFSGQDVVYAALEANPRWMKAVFGEMLAAYDADRGRIPYGFQYDALKDAAERFEALLALLPNGAKQRDAPVLDVINRISMYFNKRALGSFSTDFPTTFTVDAAVSSAIQNALRRALNAGALVHIRGPKSPPLLDELIGERFRLAYLLSIRDGLEVPMRLGKAVPLSKILRDAEPLVPDIALFDEKDY
jgi:hypothetical protein